MLPSQLGRTVSGSSWITERSLWYATWMSRGPSQYLYSTTMASDDLYGVVETEDGWLILSRHPDPLGGPVVRFLLYKRLLRLRAESQSRTKEGLRRMVPLPFQSLA